jgi:hypothetical protein
MTDRPTLFLRLSPETIEAGLDVLDRLEGVPTLREDRVREVFAAMVRRHGPVRLPNGDSEAWLDIEDAS